LIIRDFQTERGLDAVTVSAMVSWEQHRREPLRVFYTARGEVREFAGANADAFLVAALLPAMRVGEERIMVEGETCPMLRDNLKTVADQYHSWYPKAMRRLRIESAGSRVVAKPERLCHASMFTGGIDSMAVVAGNMQYFDEGDERRIRHAILVQGFDIGGYHADPEGEAFERAEKNARDMLAPHGVPLSTVTTNLIDLYRSVVFWSDTHHGAGCASVGHLLAPGITDLHIGSTYDALTLHPWGSHLATDPYCTSSGLRVWHDSAHLSRVDKVAFLAKHVDWLDKSVVCFYPERAIKLGALNCGSCEKCVRTRLELFAIGRAEVGSFATSTLTARDIKLVNISSEFGATTLRELIPMLEANGHEEIAGAVRVRMRRWARQRVYRKFRGIPGMKKFVRASGPLRDKLLRVLVRK